VHLKVRVIMCTKFGVLIFKRTDRS